MSWRTVSITILFLMLIAMPILGLQTVSAQESRSLSIGSWWTLKGTYHEIRTHSGSPKDTRTDTGEYTYKVVVTSKNSDTITLSNQEDWTWSCTAIGNWVCNYNDAQQASETGSSTYLYTIAMNTLKVTSVGGDAGKSYVGHPTRYMVNVGQLNEGGKAVLYWWVPDSNAKGDKITDVNFSVDTQTARIKGTELKVWRLSYSGDILGHMVNGVYSIGPATETYLYDPIYGIEVGYSEKFTAKGVKVGGDSSWTEDYSEDLQFVDTNLSFEFKPAQVSITLGAKPANVAVTVDNVSYTSNQLPKIFTWNPGSTHALQVDATIQGGLGLRYVFVQWSDGSKDASRSITTTQSGNLTAIFKTQYELKVTSDFGDPQGSGWYDAGSTATFSVRSSQPETGLFGSLGGKATFQKWTGDSTANTATADIVMDSPKTVQARWTIDDSQPYMILGGIGAAVVVMIILALLLMRRKKPPAQAYPPTYAPAPPPPPPAQAQVPFCKTCGRPTSYIEQYQRYYCYECKTYA